MSKDIRFTPSLADRPAAFGEKLATFSTVVFSIFVFAVIFLSPYEIYWIPTLLILSTLVLFIQLKNQPGLRSPYTIALIPLTLQNLLFPLDITYVSSINPSLPMVTLDSQAFNDACVTSIIGICTLILARAILSTQRVHGSQPSITRTSFSEAYLNLAIIICASLLLLGIVILFVINPHLISMVRSATERSGHGYMVVFWIAGYFATILVAIKTFRSPQISQGNILLLGLIIIITAFPHFLLANRGNALYPIFLTIITYFVLRPSTIRAGTLALAACLAIPLLDAITSDFRYYIITQGGDRVRDPWINMNFGQLQVMAAVNYMLDSSELKHPSLIINSLLTVIPKQLFPDKQYGLAPYISLTIMHDKWVDKNTLQHSSQFTTGPFLEFMYEFGNMGVVFISAAIAWFYSFLDRVMSKSFANPIVLAFTIFQLHLCGWLFWIADLALFVAFQTVTIIAYIFIYYTLAILATFTSLSPNTGTPVGITRKTS